MAASPHPLATIPDVHATAANMSLRYVDLNRRINADYGWFGGQFQSIIDPSFHDVGVSDVYPAWFAFAAFASRGIGKAELGAEIGLDAARFYDASGDPRVALTNLLPSTHLEKAAGLIGALAFEEARLAATFLVAFASACRYHGALTGFNFSAMLDPRVFAVCVDRLLELLKVAPGSNPLDRVASVSLTLRNAMEDGNRRIYSDIGGAAQDYCYFRGANKVTPEQVLSEFSIGGVSRPEQAEAAYRFALQHLGDSPLPIDFEELFPDLRGDARPLVVAAFALYEAAGRSEDLALKDCLVAFANNLVIYREQHEAVQPAFTPGSVLPGEVDRLKLLAIITPAIEVTLRLETWRFCEYAELHLPRRDNNPLASRVTEYNWGLFADRWAPVVDTYGPCYRNPRAMWPPPNPDPNEDL